MDSMMKNKGLTRRKVITLGLAAPLALAIHRSVEGAIPVLISVARMNWETRALWLKATLGDAEAMCDLALAYEWGDGVPEDGKRSVYWMKRAADLGCPFAQRWMSIRYEYGWGVPEDRRRAFVLLHKAADGRDWEAMLYLAGRFFEGDGVLQTDDGALEWVHRAAIHQSIEHAVIIHPAVETHLKRLGITAMEFG